MQWSKLRTALKERVAPSLGDRLAVHQARYRRTLEEVGRIWITLDGRELIAFDTNSYVARRAQIAHDMRSGTGPFALSAASNLAEYRAADQAAIDFLRRAGEYDDYSALHDLEAFLSLPIEEALVSPSPLVRGLAVVDRRVGKRRLLRLGEQHDEHPFVREMYAARCAAEGISLRHVKGEAE
jgi:hypothetical protein